MKGWGPKSSVCPSKPGESNFFCGISREFAGISRRGPKSLRKKVCVQFLAPKETDQERKISPKRKFSGRTSRFRCTLVRKSPQNVEKIARFPGGEKSVESCHVSGCHGFFSSPRSKLRPGPSKLWKNKHLRADTP